MQGTRSSSQPPGGTTAPHRSGTAAASSPTQERISVYRSCNRGGTSSGHGGTRYRYPAVGREVAKVGLVESGRIARRPSYLDHSNNNTAEGHHEVKDGNGMPYPPNILDHHLLFPYRTPPGLPPPALPCVPWPQDPTIGSESTDSVSWAWQAKVFYTNPAGHPRVPRRSRRRM